MDRFHIILLISVIQRYQLGIFMRNIMKIGKKISNNEVVSDHYRRFINVQEFLKDIKKNNFKIFYKASSNNFAKFGNERPHICRMILKKLF